MFGKNPRGIWWRGKNIKAFAGKHQTRWERTMCAGSGEKFTVVRWEKVDDVRKI
jgi:hypothetical protein